MKLCRQGSYRTMALLVMAVLLFQLTGRLGAAQATTNAAPSRAAVSTTNAAPVEPPVPQAIFVLPGTPQQGKDPFFPRSMRPYSFPTVSKTSPTNAVVDAELRLNGFSRLGTNRLAIINNATFAVGEDGEVLAGAGRTRIRCVEITDETVLVQIGGERRILRLRSGF